MPSACVYERLSDQRAKPSNQLTTEMRVSVHSDRSIRRTAQARAAAGSRTPSRRTQSGRASRWPAGRRARGAAPPL